MNQDLKHIKELISKIKNKTKIKTIAVIKTR